MFEQLRRILVITLTTALLASPTMADPGGKGGGKGGGHGKGGHSQSDHGGGKGNNNHGGSHGGGKVDIGDRDRDTIRNYFAPQLAQGNCPPGLAKKNNGCLPPGQAKKWAVGQPLPHDVVYYSLPAALLAQLTPPPAGNQYVRVGTDILMIAAGTGLVVAGLSDLLQ